MLQYEFSGQCIQYPDDNSWQIHKCRNCDHSFVNPQPSYEDLASYYRADYGPFNTENEGKISELIKKAKIKGEHRHIKISPGIDILDVGCGGGNFLSVAKALGANIQGVEPSPYAYQACLDAGLPVFNGMLTDYIASRGIDKKFDIITANHVVEHHHDPKQLIEQMISLLKPSGKIWFCVPNFGSSWAGSLKNKWYSLHLPFHLQHFTITSVKELAKQSDLELIEIRTEELPWALHGTIQTWLRVKLFIPYKISALFSFLLAPLSNWLAPLMDKKNNGQAIIVQLKLK